MYTIALKPGDRLYKFSDDGNPTNDVTSITLRRGEKAIDPEYRRVFTPLAHTNKPSPFIDMSQAMARPTRSAITCGSRSATPWQRRR